MEDLAYASLIEQQGEINTQISLELNQERIGQIYKVLVDRAEGEYFHART